MSSYLMTTSTLLRSIVYFVGGGGGRVESYEYKFSEDGHHLKKPAGGQEKPESIDSLIEGQVFSLSYGLAQGVTKRCRLSWLFNSAPSYILAQMRGEGGGAGLRGLSQ
jgi:hypothetical protein